LIRIAAITAVVSAISALRLVSAFGNATSGGGVLGDELVTAIDAGGAALDGCGCGALVGASDSASGFTTTLDAGGADAEGALAVGASRRPIEYAPMAVRPRSTMTTLPRMASIQSGFRDGAQDADAAVYTLRRPYFPGVRCWPSGRRASSGGPVGHRLELADATV